MQGFIKELRRREVFRTAGLYVGICWILIEVGSVFLPAIDAPEWLFRGAIVAAVAGFPVMLVLAWFFDVNKEGISLQADPSGDGVESLGARKSDFAIIGVLAIALVISLYLNLNKEASTGVPVLEPMSVLVAEFASTVDEPLFDNVLEHALVVGLEVAPRVGVFDSSRALQIGRQLTSDDAALSVDLARQVAQREGIALLLAGTVQQSGSEYRIAIEGIDIAGGQSSFSLVETAESRDRVLTAIATLSAKVRAQLGDSSPGDSQGGPALAFKAATYDAAGEYVSGLQFQAAGKLDDAATYFEKATIDDPNSGRALSNLALAEFQLGRTQKAETHWMQSQSMLNSMTDRERLRVLGRYHDAVTLDDAAATQIYEEFVAQYPADIDARERYASVLFRQLNFSAAADEIRAIVTQFPSAIRYRTQLALYEMYQGNWEIASDEAGQVVTVNSSEGRAYLPIAMAALADGQAEASRDAYRRMALINGERFGSTAAALGLADIDLYFGEVDQAREALLAGIAVDVDGDNPTMAALKYIALAQSYVEQEKFTAATTAAARALSLSDTQSVKVSAAMVYLLASDVSAATVIADALLAGVDAHGRAYGKMLRGLILERQGSQTEAILMMREAIEVADLWLIRFQIGTAYLRAGNNLQALGELNALNVRRGEATSVFLDDMPTYRVLAELPYWYGRVQEALKMPEARASYVEFMALRPQGGTLQQDASKRVAALD